MKKIFSKIFILATVASLFVTSTQLGHAIPQDDLSDYNRSAAAYRSRGEANCSPAQGSTSANGGGVFVLGDSIGVGFGTQLGNYLPSAEGWSVQNNSVVGRTLAQGLAVASSSANEIKSANRIIVALGTNSLGGGSNQQDINSMVTTLKNNNSSASIYWVTVNVNRSDLVAGATSFNNLLTNTTGITLIENRAVLSGDGVHPSDYADLATSIASSIKSSGSTLGAQNPVNAGGCACSTGSAGLTGSDNAEKVWNYFIGKGLSAIQVAGMLGNFQQESGIDPEKVQGGSRNQDPNSAGSSGWGLMQWTPGSKIIGLMQQAGITTPIHELSSQVELVWWHMNNVSPTGVRNFIEGFKQTSTIEASTTDFEERMEGAGKPMMERRIGYARDFYTLYANKTGGGGAIDISGSCDTITENGQDTKFIDGFTVYNQYDPSWKNLPYSSSTIGDSGCGPAAMAMIITNLTGKAVNPVETAKYAADQGMYVPGAGSSWNIGPVLAQKWGLKATNIGVNAEKIKATLQAGGLVITAGRGAKPFTQGGHFIVIRGITADGKYKVGDSGHSDTSDKEWDVDLIHAGMTGRDGSVYAITK